VQAPRLVATDVDGTLLDPDDRVTPRATAVINRLVAAGVGLVLVTGRPPRWIPPVVAALPVARLAVCANGAVLYDAADDRVVWSRTLSADTLVELAEAVGELLPGAGLAVERVGATAEDSSVAQFPATCTPGPTPTTRLPSGPSCSPGPRSRCSPAPRSCPAMRWWRRSPRRSGTWPT
jgi:hypothetical protein